LASASRCLALLVAVCVSGCAQESKSPLPITPREGTGLSRDRFIVGAWCSPPTSTTDAATWGRFYRAGNSVAIRPLEDPNDRGLNLATLELLDSLVYNHPDTVAVWPPPMTLLVRDDAVHPDETTRAGWRERVREVVRAYRGHSSLAGYFLADEPRGAAELDRLARIAAEFAAADSIHPAYINLVPIAADASSAAQAQWRASTSRLITQGRLRLFSFDAYSERPGGEDASLLVTLANAARVSRETGCPFVVVLQFTGFGPLEPMTFAQLQYVASEAVAHGASGVIWFTYWTPNPDEPGMNWRGGAVTYDGQPTARADSMAIVSARARILSTWFAGRATQVAHPGGAWPRGARLIEQSIEGLAGASGGPITVASVMHAEPPSDRTWIVINRDRTRARHIQLRLAPGISARMILARAPGSPFPVQFVDPSERTVELDLEPGGSVLVSLART
jgi:hypothetical protein